MFVELPCWEDVQEAGAKLLRPEAVREPHVEMTAG